MGWAGVSGPKVRPKALSWSLVMSCSRKKTTRHLFSAWRILAIVSASRGWRRSTPEISAPMIGVTGSTMMRLGVTSCDVGALLSVASRFGLDVVLGAFLAGVVLRRWAPGDVRSLESKLDAVGYGFFIPVFFVSSGMNLQIHSIAEAPLRLLVFFVLLLAVRGMPALLLYRRDLTVSERTQMAFLTATALPLLVALSAIGLSTGHMLPENAAALVGAGVLSVVVFPGVAVTLSRRGRPTPTYDPAEPVGRGRERGDTA